MINRTLASAALNATGLEALGHASGQLAAKWADAAPTFDEATLSLQCSAWRAPIDGHLVWSAAGAPHLTDHAGAPLTGTVAVLRIHPQGALRLKRLAADRYDGGAHRRPTPFALALRGGTPPADLPEDGPERPDTVLAGDALGAGRLTVHDERGLVIDPVAAACLLRDLLTAFPALHRRDQGAAEDIADAARPGSIAQAAALGSAAVRVHLTDLYGRPWADDADRDGMRIGTGRVGAGPHDWDGDLAVTEGATTVRFGLLPDGDLALTALAPPELPTTGSPPPELRRQWFRAAAADLPLHLAGNRTAAAVGGVPGADAATAADEAPALGTGDLEYLATGQRFLGAAGEVARLTGTRLAVGPAIADDFPLPATRFEQWPTAPAPASAPSDLTAEHAARARGEATAAYIGATGDVVVSWPAGALPAEAFVRVFPRLDPGRATVPLAQLRFAERGDGGGAVVADGAECRIRVPDPFQTGADPRPAAPSLVFDLLVVTRGPSGVRERLFGSVQAGEVADGGTAPPGTAGPNAFAAVPDDHRGLAGAPVIGLRSAAPPTAIAVLLDALAASSPRESARFATQARNESLVAGHEGAAWTAVAGPGHLTADALNGDARRGSPGLPAGPEEHAPAVRATGPLAQHLARAALRRTHHLATRIPELDDGRWNPVPGASGDATGAVLQTVPPTVESPELRAALPAATVEGLPGDWAGLIAAVGALLPGDLAALASQIPSPDAGDRWAAELKREARSAHFGRRDTLWAWRGALSRARELVYIETALLSHTAAGADEDAVDLVALLLERLAAEPNLRVVLVTPRRIPFGPGYEPFAQRMHLERNRVAQELEDAFPDRAVVYHPVGFPGRPETLRGVFATVDDVWALCGGSTFSRRGLTFDGATDLAFTGHRLRDGVSATVRDARRAAMARVLGVGPADDGATADPRWVQLRSRRGAFDLMRRTVAGGGEGEVQPLWPGLPEAELPALSKDLADPDGRDFSTTLTGLLAALAALGADRL